MSTAYNSYYNGFGELADWENGFVFASLAITEKEFLI